MSAFIIGNVFDGISANVRSSVGPIAEVARNSSWAYKQLKNNVSICREYRQGKLKILPAAEVTDKTAKKAVNDIKYPFMAG